MSRLANPQAPLPLQYSRGGLRLNPYMQVMVSYLQRPAFVVLVAALGASLVLVKLVDRVPHLFWGHNGMGFFRFANSLWWILFEMLANVSPFALTLVLVIMLSAQIREQLTNWRAGVLPGFRPPHVWAGTSIFALLSLALAVAVYGTSPGSKTSFVGTLAIILTTISLLAWLGVRGSPWMVPVVLIVFIFIGMNRGVSNALGNFMEFLDGTRDWHVLPGDLPRILASLFLIASDVVLTLVLFRDARPVTERASFPERWSRSRTPRERRVHQASLLLAHRAVNGLWSRAWHRRHGVLRPWSAAWVGGLLTVVMIVIFFLSRHARQNSDALLALVLTTLTPGLIVAAVWFERWRVVGYETLFPGHRREYVRETALVMAINFVEFWFACAVAATIALATAQPRQLSSAGFALSLLASGLTQIGVFGVLFLLTAFRSVIPYLIVIALVMIVLASPLELAWAPRPDITISRLLVITGFEIIGGLCLAWAGAWAWRRAELG